MPTWGQILKEMGDSPSRAANGGPDCDGVRRKYLAQLHALTGHATIVYATAFTEPKPTPPAVLQVALGDLQGFMEAVSGTAERELDLILHSPGGSAEAAESIISYLRQRFTHIRVFVPLAAMSAATMMALGADTIVMGKHSQLGPIDPQFTISTPEGPRSAAAKAILNQFERAKRECAADQGALAAWLPILRGYSPGLLSQCESSRELAEQMVAGWLERYMYKGDPDRATKSAFVAAWFANYDNFASHSRAVTLHKAQEIGLKVEPLEADQAMQDAVLSIFHATTHIFVQTGAGKIIENHLGRAFITMSEAVLVPAPASGQPPGQRVGGAAPQAPRSERRRQDRGR